MSDNLGPAVESEAGDDRRKKVLLGGGVSLAILLGGYLLLGGGGDTEDLAAEPVSRAPRVVAEKPGPPVQLPVAYEEQIGRDPFRALYVQPAAAPAAPAGTPAVPGLPLPAFGGGSPGGTVSQPAPPGAPTTQTYKLLLKRVYGTEADRTAVFTIDGKQQVAKIGTKFGPTSEIILLSFQEGPKPGQWTTVLQVGDGDPFDVVTGVAVFVR